MKIIIFFDKLHFSHKFYIKMSKHLDKICQLCYALNTINNQGDRHGRQITPP